MALTVVTHGQQSLPQKEQALFRKCVRLYEQKQHKNSLRCIKQILQNPSCQEHGETLSMKALILDVTGHHAESVDLAKRALKNDLKSHVCWHIFGMIMRADKKFDEASKALKKSLLLSPENPQILRDLALIQVHTRDFKGYQATRYTLLRMKPNNRQAWMGFIVAAYLAKEYDTAVKGLSEYKKPLLQNPNGNSAELFEIQQFEVRLYVESGNLDKALAVVLGPNAMFLDQTILHETLGMLYTKMGRLEEAAKEYQILIGRNPEEKSYYSKLEDCLKLSDAGKEAERLALYDETAAKGKKVLYPRIATLQFTTGEEFQRRLISYLIDGFRTGLPSLFRTIFSVYSDPAKVKVIHNFLLVLIAKCDKDGQGVCFDGSGVAENPTTVMWTLYFCAHHFDTLKDFAKAEEFILRAIDHTPSVVELYVCHARINKHNGNLEKATEIMKYAHELDTADRYVNCKLVKYQMRCGMFENGIEYAGKFTKETTDPLTSLIDMQTLWIEIELANALLLRDRWGAALKVCHEIDNQFANFYDDQYDFHSYCMRKATICGYADLIKSSDVIRNHRVFIKAAIIATKIYLQLADVKEGKMSLPEGLTDKKTERKKQGNNVFKKAEEKKDEKEAQKFKIDDESGKSFIELEKPLEKADGFMSQLLSLEVDNFAFYKIAFVLYQRMGKFLIMSKLIANAYRKFMKSAEFYQLLDDYVAYLNKNPQQGLHATVAEVLLNKITNGVEYASFKKHVSQIFGK